ncbi:MAG TPA: LuxR C-terminal-related transcriptional regulator [Bacteroidia bacterium]
MSKLLPKKQSPVPIYEEYHNFLKEMGHTTQFKDYKQYLKQYAFFNSMVHAMPSAAYILNYETQQYLFVSKSYQSITGYTDKEYIEKGRAFFLARMHPDDLKIHSGAAFTKFIEFIKQLPPKEIKKYRFSLNYRIKRKDGVYIKVLQQYIILEVNDKGYPLLSLGLVTDVTAHKVDNKMIFSASKYDKKKGFEVISSETYPKVFLSISKREHEVVKYMLQGLSSKMIADKLSLSPYTIIAHRRNILEKTNCKNTAELSSYAMLNGLG